LNLFEVDGYRVIVDYCHNAAGMRMLGDFVDRLASPPKGGDVMARRRTGVIASPGDRRDKDIRELGEVAARHFDALIVRGDRNPRRPRPGEVAELIAAGARASAADGARCRSLEVVLDELEASRLALDRSNPCDLGGLRAAQVDTTVA